jgi:hypothetical protein
MMGANNEPTMPMDYSFDASAGAGGGSGATVYNDTLDHSAVGMAGGREILFDASGYGQINSSEWLNAAQLGNSPPTVINPDTITVNGVSAAHVDVYGSVDYDQGDTSYMTVVTTGNHVNNTLYNDGNSPWFQLDNYSGYGNTSQNFGDLTADHQPIVFADGSLLIINVDASGQFNNNVLTGGAHDDQLIASWGNNDRLAGNAGNDLLIGGDGNNQIYGGAGADTILGWGGNDFLSGGTGADTFVFTKNMDFFGGTTGRDTITDFTVGSLTGHDVIDITDVDPATFLTFTAGHLVADANAIQSGADTLIILGANDSIRLQNVILTNLTTDNFENVHFTVDGHSI